MNRQEGVIKYRLKHQYCILPIDFEIKSINAWRTILFKLRLIGQTPEKYQGLGYGNLSLRLKPNEMPFLISGTQTSHLDCLSMHDFAIVDSASPTENVIHSRGKSKPSSEALTHASVYLHNPNANAVIHVHCPEIWRNAVKLRLPHTDADVAYGTVEMAEAVENLLTSEHLAKTPVFAMLGHEDGIVAFGDNPASAAIALLTEFANAIAIEQTIKAG
ncbi:class II aldolase/adducin family protein [Methylomonas sp. MgM2]